MQRAAVASLAVGLFLVSSTTLGLPGLLLLLAGTAISGIDALLRSDASVAAWWAFGLGVVTVLAAISLWYSPAAVVTAPVALFLAWIAHRAGVRPRVVRAAVVAAAGGLAVLLALVIYLLVAE
jgi:hypothetical protein